MCVCVCVFCVNGYMCKGEVCDGVCEVVVPMYVLHCYSSIQHMVTWLNTQTVHSKD